MPRTSVISVSFRFQPGRNKILEKNFGFIFVCFDALSIRASRLSSAGSLYPNESKGFSLVKATNDKMVLLEQG